jgi:hypothetical protein
MQINDVLTLFSPLSKDKQLLMPNSKNDISVMDSGLNEFRLDLLEYVKQNGSMNALPFGFRAVVATSKSGSEGDIAEVVDRGKQRQRLEREIAASEKKILREKQFNRQVALNGELKRLRAELERLG